MGVANAYTKKFVLSTLFERSEFLIATCEKKKPDRLCGCVCVCGCTANLGFSVRSANRIRPKDGIPLPDQIHSF